MGFGRERGASFGLDHREADGAGVLGALGGVAVDATSFIPHRSGGDHEIREEEPLAVVDGTVTITIDPMELVTLRSAAE